MPLLNLAIDPGQEAGHKFKGKTITKLMKYKANNNARNFFKHVPVPLEA